MKDKIIFPADVLHALLKNLDEEDIKVFQCFINNEVFNQNQLVKISGLTLNGVRVATTKLDGAMLLNKGEKGRASVYRLTPNGIQLFEYIKKKNKIT